MESWRLEGRSGDKADREIARVLNEMGVAQQVQKGSPLNRRARREISRMQGVVDARNSQASGYAARLVRKDAVRTAAIKKIERNGITLADLDKTREDAFKEGYNIAATDMLKGCYAAFCLALRELYGFGEQRCIKALKRADEIILTRLNGEELIDRVFDELKIKLDFSDPLDRVQEGE